MNIEKTKTVVLSLLVSLSLILTWGLWTFQPQYDFIQSTEYIQNVMIGEKRQFNEVIKPLQFIYHEDGSYYGLTDPLMNNELYKMMLDLNVAELETVSYASSEQLYSSVQQDSSLEMIFPIKLPIEMVNFIMDPIKHEWNIDYFDRIIVNFNKNPSLYFVFSENNQAVKLKIDDPAIENMKEKLMTSHHKFPAYFTLNASKGTILYLPEQPFKIEQLTFSTQNVPAAEFKNALFNDPGRVKQYSLKNGAESFTDGSKALEIFNNQSMMRFINPASKEIYNLGSEELILKSIEFVNDHSGWTDSFALMDWNEEQQNIVFRLMVNGFPVFSSFDPNGETTIQQSWRDSEIYEYQRALINLRFSIESERKQAVMPSGRQLLSYLAQIKSNFDPNLLENSLIGFHFTKENSNTSVISVQPSWFIKYNGNWEEIRMTKTIIDPGGNNNGLG